MSLNHAQTEAVAHNEGPCMVLAGPGSGKTLTIAKRIEYLITKYKEGQKKFWSLPLLSMQLRR